MSERPRQQDASTLDAAPDGGRWSWALVVVAIAIGIGLLLLLAVVAWSHGASPAG
jgi:hypothetical protein